MKALQLLRIISSKDWGGDRTTLLKIYWSTIRSKLDVEHHTIESHQVETGEPSLQTRRLKLSLQYYAKMKANLANPAYSCAVNPEFRRLFISKPRTMPTLGIRLQPHLEDTKVDLDSISVVRPPECPPWLLQQPNMLFNLSDLRKGDTCPLVFQNMLLDIFVDF